MQKILVVDDHDGIRMLLCEILKKKGYEMFDAQSGKQAMDLFKEVQPDLVFLDIKMPEMDGIEVLKRMKETHAHVLVIMMTAYYNDTKSISKAINLGALTCIDKPFDVDDIQQVVSRAISHNEPT